MNPYKDLITAVKKATEEKDENKFFAESFLREFNDTLIEIEKDRQQEVPTDYFRPSSLYGCKRMLWAMRSGIPPEPDFDPNLIGITESGTDRHERIQHVVGKMPGVTLLDVMEQVRQAQLKGINTEFVKWNEAKTEARFKNEDLKIYFQPDGIIQYRGIKAILEIKTESTFKWSPRLEPELDHKMQATAYAFGMGLDYVLFFYEDRNFTRKKPYLWKVEDEIKEELFHKVETVHHFLELGTPPPKEDGKCTYCRYRGWCKTID